jgi:outer membrane protein assembly factor BamB
MFLTVNQPLDIGTPAEQAAGSDILGLCLDTRTGHELWRVVIPGRKLMPHTGLFTDPSTPTPVADETHVWFVNAAGGMMCLDHGGQEVWRRRFYVEHLHNAKNCHPMLVDGKLLYVELLNAQKISAADMAEMSKLDRNSGDGPWSWLHAFDAATGENLWVAESATSVHSAPGAGVIDGQPVVLHARGGGHNTPEKPYGYTLTHLDSGRTIWNREVDSGYAFMNSHFDEQHAYVFDSNRLLVLNISSGEIQRELDISSKTDWCMFNADDSRYEIQHDVPFATGAKAKSYPTRNSNILVGKYVLFLAHDRPSIGRVDLESGRVEYLDVPYQVLRKTGQADQPLWQKHIPSDVRNGRGMLITADQRAFGSGWGHVTCPAPVEINGQVYFTTMLGSVYVVDAHASRFDADALKWIGDLGAAGETWTLAPVTYAAGRLYARTLKEVVCIGELP